MGGALVSIGYLYQSKAIVLFWNGGCAARRRPPARHTTTRIASILVIRDGRISEVREYLDSLHADTVRFGAAPSH
jgi:ketosteroid isomerase-like protein